MATILCIRRDYRPRLTPRSQTCAEFRDPDCCGMNGNLCKTTKKSELCASGGPGQPGCLPNRDHAVLSRVWAVFSS
jgi:hypothetical protein